MSTLSGTRLAVVDIEGNGAHPPEIIEVAVLPVDDGVPGDLATWLVRPVIPIAPVVTRKVHGIRDADVANCPPWTVVAEQVYESLRGRTLVAHNAAVERRVLGDHLPAWQPSLVLDTLRLAKHVWTGLPGHTLDALITHAGVDATSLPGQRHRAGHDAWCTWHLLLAMSAGLNWPTLRTFAALPKSTVDKERGLW